MLLFHEIGTSNCPVFRREGNAGSGGSGAHSAAAIDPTSATDSDGRRWKPLLPLRPGIPARQTHDYKRNGTTTLFAALSMLDSKVIGDCMPRHRYQEFIRFLKRIDEQTPHVLDLHLIVDSYSTHKHPRVIAWLKRHLHFIPTSSSWLNLVEWWFRELTDKRLRRGSFQNVPELIAAITHYIENHNQNPQVFVWSASVEKIMTKIAKCKEALDAPH